MALTPFNGFRDDFSGNFTIKISSLISSDIFSGLNTHATRSLSIKNCSPSLVASDDSPKEIGPERQKPTNCMKTTSKGFNITTRLSPDKKLRSNPIQKPVTVNHTHDDDSMNFKINPNRLSSSRDEKITPCRHKCHSSDRDDLLVQDSQIIGLREGNSQNDMKEIKNNIKVFRKSSLGKVIPESCHQVLQKISQNTYPSGKGLGNLSSMESREKLRVSCPLQISRRFCLDNQNPNDQRDSQLKFTEYGDSLGNLASSQREKGRDFHLCWQQSSKKTIYSKG